MMLTFHELRQGIASARSNWATKQDKERKEREEGEGKEGERKEREEKERAGRGEGIKIPKARIVSSPKRHSFTPSSNRSVWLSVPWNKNMKTLSLAS